MSALYPSVPELGSTVIQLIITQDVDIATVDVLHALARKIQRYSATMCRIVS